MLDAPINGVKSALGVVGKIATDTAASVVERIEDVINSVDLLLGVLQLLLEVRDPFGGHRVTAAKACLVVDLHLKKHGENRLEDVGCLVVSLDDPHEDRAELDDVGVLQLVVRNPDLGKSGDVLGGCGDVGRHFCCGRSIIIPIFKIFSFFNGFELLKAPRNESLKAPKNEIFYGAGGSGSESKNHSLESVYVSIIY